MRGLSSRCSRQATLSISNFNRGSTLTVAEHHRLQVKTSLEELTNVLDWFNGHYQEKLARSVLIKSQTILAEAFTNVVRHAHRDKQAETPIEIVVCLQDQQIEIQVWDYGPEFDLGQQLRKSEPIDSEASGGRGIWLIASLTDRLYYQRTSDNRNCLHMINHLIPNPSLPN